jgi:hypothetical protein
VEEDQRVDEEARQQLPVCSCNLREEVEGLEQEIVSLMAFWWDNISRTGGHDLKHCMEQNSRGLR